MINPPCSCSAFWLFRDLNRKSIPSTRVCLSRWTGAKPWSMIPSVLYSDGINRWKGVDKRRQGPDGNVYLAWQELTRAGSGGRQSDPEDTGVGWVNVACPCIFKHTPCHGGVFIFTLAERWAILYLFILNIRISRRRRELHGCFRIISMTTQRWKVIHQIMNQSGQIKLELIYRFFLSDIKGRIKKSS